MVNEHENNWDKYIPRILFSYCVRKHSTTGVSPYKLMFCREPILHEKVLTGDIILSKKDFENQTISEVEMARINARVIKQILESANKNKERYDKKYKPSDIKIGDLVWRINIKKLKNKDKK